MTEADRLLDEAFLAYNNKDFDEAEDLARSVLTLMPSSGDGLYLLGLIAGKKNAFEPAEKLLYQAVHLYPENKQYKLSLGFVLEKQGRLDEALSFYEEFKEDAFVLSQIGFIYLQKGLTDFAKSAFDKALSLNESVLTAYIGLALLLRREENFDEALNVLQKALSFGKSAELLYQLAQTSRLLKKNNQALSYIKEALALEETAAFYNEEGLIYEAMKTYSAAFLSYEDAIRLNSYYADAYANMGNLYFKEGKLNKAEDAYKRAIGIDSSFLNAHHNLALVLHKQGRVGECLEHFRSAILINPKHISSLYNLAVILEESGEYSEAAGLYFNLLVLDNTLPDIEFRIAQVLSLLAQTGKKEKKQALTFIEGWVKNFPDNVVALYTQKALTGKKVDEALAQKYSEALYDSFASSYDKVMEKLESKSLAEILNALPQRKWNHVLDAACGTGTFALKFEQEYDSLTGVDISKNMLMEADKTFKYTRLVHQDIYSFLQEDKEEYSLIVASDVIGYLPQVDQLFKAVYAKLEEKGIFAFTFETNDLLKEGELQPSGRMVYPTAPLKDLLLKQNFKIEVQKEFLMRKEGTSFAKGMLFVVSK